MNDVIVTIAHVRAAKIHGTGVLCAPGIRLWLDRHNISLSDFLENGMPVAEAVKLNCPFADRAIAIAIAEREQAGE